MCVCGHDNNAGALVLAPTLPPELKTESKYCATKTVWFHEEIQKSGVKLLDIDTKEQPGDILIKVSHHPQFEYLRNTLM